MREASQWRTYYFRHSFQSSREGPSWFPLFCYFHSPLPEIIVSFCFLRPEEAKSVLVFSRNTLEMDQMPSSLYFAYFMQAKRVLFGSRPSNPHRLVTKLDEFAGAGMTRWFSFTMWNQPCRADSGGVVNSQ